MIITARRVTALAVAPVRPCSSMETWHTDSA